MIALGFISIGWTSWLQDQTVDNLTVMGTLKTAGNVGIGTTSPQGALDVDGDVYIDGTIYADELHLSTTGDVAFTGGNVGIGTSAPTQLFEVNGIIYGHSNVGIGISAPADKLAVDGTVYFNPNKLSSSGAGSRMGIRTDGRIYLY